MRTLVMKFGGSAVGMTTGLTQMLHIILAERERWDQLLVVVSALEGVTDSLIEAAHLAELDMSRGYRRIVATLRTRHMSLIEHLPMPAEKQALQADIDRLLFDLLDQCQRLADRTLPASTRSEIVDSVAGLGEKMAARIVAALLRQNNVRGVAIDATDILITDNIYGNATPNFPLTRERIERVLLPMLERQIIPVITGFIGSTATGKPTTLGRGGSDYTASIVAACTDADEVWLWTDVDGLMSADPFEHPSAQIIPALNYEEAAELAYFGARLLHTRMIAPLQAAHMPLYIRNVFRPQGAGTRIGLPEQITSRFATEHYKAVTNVPAIGLSLERNGSLAEVARLMDELMFTTLGTHAEVMITAQSAVSSFACFVIPTSAGQDAVHPLLQAVRDALPSLGNGWSARPVVVVSVIGRVPGGIAETAFSSAPGQLLQTISGVPILAMQQNHTGSMFSIVLETEDADEAITRLHDHLLNGRG